MSTKSTFLLSNDDGYKSLGIQNLRNYLLDHGNVILVAPRNNKALAVVLLQSIKNQDYKN